MMLWVGIKQALLCVMSCCPVSVPLVSTNTSKSPRELCSALGRGHSGSLVSAARRLRGYEKEGVCVHPDLARTGRNGPSKHRERHVASSPYSINGHGIGITNHFLIQGSWHFYTNFLFMRAWEVFWKDNPKNLSDYVCRVKNHWH